VSVKFDPVVGTFGAVAGAVVLGAATKSLWGAGVGAAAGWLIGGLAPPLIPVTGVPHSN